MGAAGDRRDSGRLRGTAVKVYVAAEFAGIGVPVHAHINNDDTFRDHVAGDHPGPSGGDDKDLGFAGNGGKVHGPGMAQGDGGVGVQQHLRNRQAHDVGPADDDGPFSLGVHARGREQFQDALGRAGGHVRGLLPEPGDIQRMESVHVFRPVDGGDNLRLADLPGEGQLNEDAVDFGVGIQRGNLLQQHRFRGGFFHHKGRVLDAAGLAGLGFVPDIDDACRVFPYADNDEMRHPSILRGRFGDPLRHLRLQLG